MGMPDKSDNLIGYKVINWRVLISEKNSISHEKKPLSVLIVTIFRKPEIVSLLIAKMGYIIRKLMKNYA